MKKLFLLMMSLSGCSLQAIVSHTSSLDKLAPLSLVRVISAQSLADENTCPTPTRLHGNCPTTPVKRSGYCPVPSPKPEAALRNRNSRYVQDCVTPTSLPTPQGGDEE